MTSDSSSHCLSEASEGRWGGRHVALSGPGCPGWELGGVSSASRMEGRGRPRSNLDATSPPRSAAF